MTQAERAKLHWKMDAEIARLVSDGCRLSNETPILRGGSHTDHWLPITCVLLAIVGFIGGVIDLLIVLHR